MVEASLFFNINSFSTGLIIHILFIAMIRSCVCWIVLSHTNLLFFYTHMTLVVMLQSCYVTWHHIKNHTMILKRTQIVRRITSLIIADQQIKPLCENIGNFWDDTYVFCFNICVCLTTISHLVGAKKWCDLLNALGFIPEFICCFINFCQRTIPIIA